MKEKFFALCMQMRAEATRDLRVRRRWKRLSATAPRPFIRLSRPYSWKALYSNGNSERQKPGSKTLEMNLSASCTFWNSIQG